MNLATKQSRVLVNAMLRWVRSRSGEEEKWSQEGLDRVEKYEEFMSLGLVTSPNNAQI